MAEIFLAGAVDIEDMIQSQPGGRGPSAKSANGGNVPSRRVNMDRIPEGIRPKNFG